MRSFEDTETGKNFVGSTTREALGLFAPQYEKDTFSLAEVHNEALVAIQIQEDEASIYQNEVIKPEIKKDKGGPSFD